MNCKDCLYYDFCNDYNEYPDYIQHCEQTMGTEFKCSYFKDKSRFIELPCKVGDTAYYVVGNGDNSRIIEEGLEGFSIIGDKLYVIDECKDFYEVGVEVFLSKQEAEKALEERRIKK